jgi:hypothetical protein
MHIVFVEPFDPAANPEFESETEFKSRIALLNRDTILAESTPREFAEAHGFHMLPEDDVATNPDVIFMVESLPTDDFKPSKPYLTRIKWRDRACREQVRILLSKKSHQLACSTLSLRNVDDSV